MLISRLNHFYCKRSIFFCIYLENLEKSFALLVSKFTEVIYNDMPSGPNNNGKSTNTSMEDRFNNNLLKVRHKLNKILFLI